VRRHLAAAIVAAGALSATAPAVAHVDVLPTEVVAEEPAEFTIRVPSERDVPTTAVRVDFPDEVTVFSFADPPPGWSLRPIRSDDGRIVGVDYRGGRIGPERFQDFTLLGTPFEVGTTLWPARQTYADGQVKPWTAPPEGDEAEPVETGPTDPGPAAAVEVLSAGTDLTASNQSGGGDDSSGAAVWLGVIAIVIAALAALGVGLLWSSRPARLPEDRD
jgi:uncharacterized protein YcnI